MPSGRAHMIYGTALDEQHATMHMRICDLKHAIGKQRHVGKHGYAHHGLHSNTFARVLGMF